jgi:hypothetical protein
MSPNQLEEAMAIRITVAIWIVAIILQPMLTVSHTLLMDKPHNNSQQCQCTMVVLPKSEVMEELDHNNHSNLTLAVLNLMLVHQLNLCKAWFQVNH